MAGGALGDDGSLAWVDFYNPAELIRYTNEADIGWMSFRRLQSIVEQQPGGRLRRRQDLPPEAFYDVERYQFNIPFKPPSREGTSRAVVLSHAWWSREHPDPQGRQLRAFVAYMRPVWNEICERYGDDSVIDMGAEIAVRIDDNAVAQLVEVLPMYRNLERLRLDAESMTSVAVTAVVNLLLWEDLLPNLKELVFNVSGVVDEDEGRNLLGCLHQLRPDLRILPVEPPALNTAPAA